MSQTRVSQFQPFSYYYGTDSRLRYSCDGGRRFEDGLTSRMVLCDVLAAWNDSAFTCDCVYTVSPSQHPYSLLLLARRVRSIVLSLSVCLFVCLLVRPLA